VRNMPVDLPGDNAFCTDPVLVAALERARTSWAEPAITELGALIGSPELEELSRAANTYVPTLHTHDRFGGRLDRVEFHPAYHELMRLSVLRISGPLPALGRGPARIAGGPRSDLLCGTRARTASAA
jgi:Adaptive response protein AidB N-terminal domain